MSACDTKRDGKPVGVYQWVQGNVFLLISTLLPTTIPSKNLSLQVHNNINSVFSITSLKLQFFQLQEHLKAFYLAICIWSFRIDLSYVFKFFSLSMRVETIQKTATVFRNVRFLPPAEFQHPGLEEKVEVSQSGEMATALVRQRSTGKQ